MSSPKTLIRPPPPGRSVASRPPVSNPTARYRRRQGKRLSYDLEGFPDGSYTVLLDGRELKHGIVDAARLGGSFAGMWSARQALARAQQDVELLVDMNED